MYSGAKLEPVSSMQILPLMRRFTGMTQDPSDPTDPGWQRCIKDHQGIRPRQNSSILYSSIVQYFTFPYIKHWLQQIHIKSMTLSGRFFIHCHGSWLPRVWKLIITRKLCYRNRALWAVAEIWPFEIFQRLQRPPSWFVRTGNSAIRSAIPENSTLEQNMKWIGRPVAEISPLEIFPTWRWPPSWICSNRK